MLKDSYKFAKYLPAYNESRWADPAELKNAPTIKRIDICDDDCQGSGLPIISDGRETYVDDSDTHSLVFGATGSKKTRLFALPLINIFALGGESFIVTDPKGEIYKKTSGFVESKEYDIIVLNFRDLEESSLWNPLALIHDMYHSGNIDESVSLMNDFINVINQKEVFSKSDPYWSEMASSLTLAFMLVFIETSKKEEANIYNLIKFIMEKTSIENVEALESFSADGSIASLNFKSILTNKESEKTYACVNSTTAAMFTDFITQKKLCQLLSQSSFDMRNIGKKKTAIYIIVPDEKTTLHFLITMFVKQVYEVLIAEAQSETNKTLPKRVNFLLDEFGNIPTIPDMASMITAARSRNIRFFMLVQGMHQLKYKYNEEAETIKGNCDNWIFLTSREFGLLDELSKLCGETFFVDIDRAIKSRPLISISSLQRLSKENGQALIIHGRHFPFVSTLPDIDDYLFKSFPPVERKHKRLPNIKKYDFQEIALEITAGKRPLLFLEEVGVRKYNSDIVCTNPQSEVSEEQIKNDLSKRLASGELVIEDVIDELVKIWGKLRKCEFA